MLILQGIELSEVQTAAVSSNIQPLTFEETLKRGRPNAELVIVQREEKLPKYVCHTAPRN